MKQQAKIRKITSTTNKYSGLPAVQVLFELKGTGEGKELVKTINVNRNEGTQYAFFLLSTGVDVKSIDTFEQFKNEIEGKVIEVTTTTRKNDNWIDIQF